MATKARSKKASATKKAARKKTVKTVKKARKPVGKKVAKKAPKAAAAPKAKARHISKSRLKKADLAEFRKMLLEKRQAILGDMGGLEAEALRTNRQEGSGDLSNMPTHPADISTDNFEQEFTLGLLESERVLLEQIHEALERIDGGTFGICLGTGRPIQKSRLKARPWSKYCIEYARLVEKGRVRPGEPYDLDDQQQ